MIHADAFKTSDLIPEKSYKNIVFFLYFFGGTLLRCRAAGVQGQEKERRHSCELHCCGVRNSFAQHKRTSTKQKQFGNGGNRREREPTSIGPRKVASCRCWKLLA